MTKNIFYFHGFKSSSDSNKAKIFKRFLKDNSKTTKIFVPDLKNKFEEAIKQKPLLMALMAKLCLLEVP